MKVGVGMTFSMEFFSERTAGKSDGWTVFRSVGARCRVVKGESMCLVEES